MSGIVGNNLGRDSGLVKAAVVGPDAIGGDEIADNAIGLEHMSSESVDEDNLHISNAGSNGQFIQKQSGNAGGLTWASSGIVQVVNTQSGALATGTTTLPMDGTIPQNTEGTEFLTLAITPANSSNTLVIQVNFYGACTTAGRTVSCALFQDSTANALAVDSHYQTQTNEKLSNFVLEYYMTAGTTSSTTFKVRAGGDASMTMMMNGSHSGNLDHGAAIKSSITIWEISA